MILRSLPFFCLGLLGATLTAQDALSCVEILAKAPIYSPGLSLDEMPEVNLEIGLPITYLWRGKLVLQDSIGRPESQLQAPTLPPGGNGLKYRASQFWASQGQSILVFLPSRGEWVPRLLSKAPFRGFDVTFDGRIALFGTRDHMAEFYQPFSSQPESSNDYPALDGLPDDLKPADYPKFFWLNPVARMIDEYLLIYFPNLGRMYKVDILKSTSDEISTPWSQLQPKAAAEEAMSHGVISVTGRPTFNSLELIPETSTSLRVAYQMSDAQFELRPPPAGDPRPKLVESKPSTQQGFHWFDLDLVNGSCGQKHDEPGLSLPQLLDSAGRWASPEKILTPPPAPKIALPAPAHPNAASTS